ncbi:MAG TPA: ATP-binding protein, partial [Desulfuromonadaceae bacterium]|nr:ATP-binding protein [Desulfuromonadaceae bacterium]
MIYYDVPHAFSAEEIRPAQTVASQIGFAIERKRSETELKRARDEAEGANRAKDDFLAALSHELRTPLNPVLLLASDAAGNHELPPGVRTDFDTIRKNVELEARLIDDLLDISRITRGKLVMEMEPVNVHAALAAAVEKVQIEMMQKQIHFILKTDAPEFTVHGDAVRLQQVFWNLLKNAVKFTPVRGTITLETRADRDHMIIRVIDSGIGMAAGELAVVFEAFSQGERATAHQFGGLGLGLAISRSLVTSHSGQIQADSPGPGLGSTFTVTLPLLDPADLQNFRHRGRGGATARALHPDFRPLAILLVEDHEPTRNSLTQLLLRRRHKVITASTINEARDLAAKESFDLLISDIGLPDGSGVELMRELSVRHKVKGIALTGYGTEQDVINSQDAGFSAHLTKPVRIDSLDTTLAEIFAPR